jgi:serine/threonine protein kinase
MVTPIWRASPYKKSDRVFLRWVSTNPTLQWKKMNQTWFHQSDVRTGKSQSQFLTLPPPPPVYKRAREPRMARSSPIHSPLLPILLLTRASSEMKRPAAAVAQATPRKSRRIVPSSAEQYEEMRSLGKGSYGAVVKAQHQVTGKIVAIKHVIAADGDPEKELKTEARFLEACGGIPFVVRYHGVVRNPATKKLSLVMEYVGPSILDFLRQQKQGSTGSPPQLPESTLRAVMWQLLTGAAEMHARGIIHRDIKPENILIAEDQSAVKICDFGLAMSTSDPPPYEPAGTMWYKAPEMLLDIPHYDARVDTWSLGCVMATIIKGSALFQGCYEDGQLCAIFDVLGVPDEETWPGFSSTAFATVVLPEMSVQEESWLRELIPETMLSEQGFQVLNGLLTCNPENRLTAAIALKLPWFDGIDATELPIKKEAAPTLPLPKKTKKPLKVPALKRQKLQFV